MKKIKFNKGMFPLNFFLIVLYGIVAAFFQDFAVKFQKMGWLDISKDAWFVFLLFFASFIISIFITLENSK